MARAKRKTKSGLKVFLIFILLLAIAAVIVIKVFTVKNVVITGNKYYPNEMIESWVLNDEYSWNTLWVYLKYKVHEPEAIPFIDTMEIKMQKPNTIEIEVYEKGMLGYVYMDSFGQNAYFDKDGIVVETSSEIIKGVPRVSGLSMDSVVLYEQLPIKGKSVLKNLLNLTQTLKKYELVPDNIIYEKDKTYTLEFGDTKVLLGNSEHFSEKVLRMSYIMPQLEGMSGTLHLESWTENTTDISFKKNEE